MTVARQTGTRAEVDAVSFVCGNSLRLYRGSRNRRVRSTVDPYFDGQVGFDGARSNHILLRMSLEECHYQLYMNMLSEGTYCDSDYNI